MGWPEDFWQKSREPEHNDCQAHEYRGYKFAIDIQRIRALLRNIVDEYEKKDAADFVSVLCEGLPLPDIRILDEIVATGSLFGSEFKAGGQYCPKKKEISISAQAAYKKIVGEGFSDAQRWFSYAVAHELRHWIQDVAKNIQLGYGFRSLLRYLYWPHVFSVFASYFICFAGALIFISVSTGIALTTLYPFTPWAWIQASLLIFAGFISLTVLMLLLGGVFTGLRSIKFFKDLLALADSLYNVIVHKLISWEVDAERFGQYASKNPEWRTIVSIEEVANRRTDD